MELIAQHTISKNNQEIPVLIYRKRKKHSSATFRGDTLRIYVSHHVRGHDYEAIIRHFTNWAQHTGNTPQLQWLQQRMCASTITDYQEKQWQLQWKWSTTKSVSCRLQQDTIILRIPVRTMYINPEHPSTPDYTHLPAALLLQAAKALTKTLAVHYGATIQAEVQALHRQHFPAYTLGKLGFQYVRSRWGSCDRLGNIMLNTQLLLLPKKYLHYVIIHELAHLKYKHHKPVFWAQVAHILPSYERLRKELNHYV